MLMSYWDMYYGCRLMQRSPDSKYWGVWKSWTPNRMQYGSYRAAQADSFLGFVNHYDLDSNGRWPTMYWNDKLIIDNCTPSGV